VSPGLAPDVIETCHQYGVAVVPGAVTPTEIMQAIKLGVDLVKVLPAFWVTPKCFPDMLAPFPQLRFMAAAGITLDNVGEYIASGVAVVTLAAQSADAEAFAEKDYARITRTAKQFVAAVHEARAGST
jgi:2-dehydro-3-deoxyphosphogluconate aldolase/(4S)-4-hydroxy-2-oxoglutarate aldolase